MKTLRVAVPIVLIAGFMLAIILAPLALGGCANTKPCIVQAETLVVKKDGLTVLADVFNVVLAGGAGLSALIDEVIAEFGDPVAKCVITAINNAVNPPASTKGTAAVRVDRPVGATVLQSEVSRRGWE